MSKRSLKVEKSSLSKFLDSISRINESCIVEVRDGVLSAITASADNTLLLYGEITNTESNYNSSLNLPDIKKLNRVIESIPTDKPEFTLENNNIQYSGSGLKFKYHLYEDGFLTKPPINIEKIKSFEYDVVFTLTKDNVNSLIKSSVFATDSNKMYLFTEEGKLKCELTDRAKHNTDAITLDLCDVDFVLNPIPLNLDNIKAINMIDSEVKFNINTKFGVMIIDIIKDAIKLKYIITSLTQ